MFFETLKNVSEKELSEYLWTYSGEKSLFFLKRDD
jgi:hypothetical protein